LSRRHYDFGDVSVRVIPSLHSPLGDKRYYQSEVVEAGATRPLRINQLVEGGSLMFLVRIGGPEVMTMGSMNYIAREVEGSEIAYRTEWVDAFAEEVHAASPNSRVIPKHLEPIRLSGR